MIGYDEESDGSLVRQKLLLTKSGGVGHSIWVEECHRRRWSNTSSVVIVLVFIYFLIVLIV